MTVTEINEELNNPQASMAQLAHNNNLGKEAAASPAAVKQSWAQAIAASMCTEHSNDDTLVV